MLRKILVAMGKILVVIGNNILSSGVLIYTVAGETDMKSYKSYLTMICWKLRLSHGMTFVKIL